MHVKGELATPYSVQCMPFTCCNISLQCLDGLLISLQGTGEAKLGAKMDGLLTRDLQIRPEAKFAFFIRPLPSRAKQLSAQANLFRRRLLKVDAVTKARRRSDCPFHTVSSSYTFLPCQMHMRLVKVKARHCCTYSLL